MEIKPTPKYTKTQLANSVELLDMVGLVTSADWEHVYKPMDDSYLMLDTLFAETELLLAKSPQVIAELGCGSGFVINNITAHLANHGHIVQTPLCSDINIEACFLTQSVSKRHNLHTQVTLQRFLSLTKDTSCDVVICNPPYVVTDEEELQLAKDNLHKKMQLVNEVYSLPGENAAERRKRLREANCVDSAWVGGGQGIEFFEQIVQEAYRVLKIGGWFYFLMIEDNQPEEVAEFIKEIGFRESQLLSYRRNEIIYPI